MTRHLLAVSAIIAISAGSAWGQQGFITAEDVEISRVEGPPVTTTEQFMGMSMNAPPNENAAASRGVRTETTTKVTTTITTGDVTGPPGQINQRNYTCNNCTSSNVQVSTSERITDFSVTGPGNRSE